MTKDLRLHKGAAGREARRLSKQRRRRRADTRNEDQLAARGPGWILWVRDGVQHGQSFLGVAKLADIRARRQGITWKEAYHQLVWDRG